MAIKFIILISMIFCHIVDDYYLQGWLASAKQKSWWEQNAPEKLFKYDYIAALFMHSFSWTFMVMLVPTVRVVLFGGTWYPLLFAGNVMIHMFVDDLKANKKRINLIQDQSIHMLQILWTWLYMIVL
ncbi:DUF3307 domain-containing protein [Enterocloster clostridioformis]|uniref:DUF3307 domain-containing protein n=1 Tax=Enterocloster clostridioformis TaxID=1531 RepID=A0AAP9LWD6_9FIRM|nr:DUF3307 domain-containing protein [Enterocloster clostridioformis]EHG33267.1 hypothetical protein HMPREF9467_00878 [ [[Clostridium] clostridioforme 2_1_49FAA]ENZ28619.1 hypothetical protein HMPREF1087_01112 [[Clostridium] clostridioforme 90A1]ENZ73450.1 hypothetical protein HMPREF1081_00059 [[Clostridium] clostridioforme 90A4]QIX89191.1 DUF3307 domain-containing protein [Enterocloster clostridioformis]